MKRIYSFGEGKADGQAGMTMLLGGKGANLHEMSSLGLPVPPGFTITTDVCRAYMASAEGARGEAPVPADLMEEVRGAVAGIERALGKGFGDRGNPLLVSVRSGAAASMPGMMDTVLNLGLNDETVLGLAELSGDLRFAWDSYRRFVMMYADVVMDFHRAQLERLIDDRKRERGVTADTAVSAADWKDLVRRMKALIQERSGKEFPSDPWVQLEGAIRAVFRSWNNARAVFYRKQHAIPDSWGTAVNVQAMVFGNMGEDCATGVAFTRDPKSGERIFFGEFLVNAQGEDVVAGIRTPQHVNRLGDGAKSGAPTLQEVMPRAYADLEAIYKKLELHYKDMQDIEFTVEKGRLFMLQTRRGKRTGPAAVRIAVDMVMEGLIDRAEAIRRVEADQVNQLLHPTVDTKAQRNTIARGLPASPGAATGKAVFSADDAVRIAAEGHPVILVTEETSPEDIHGMTVARGILTQRGGQTSHAAVVARGMGRVCVVGCGEIQVHRDRRFTAKGKDGKVIDVREGDVITLDGGTGEVMLGTVALAQRDPRESGLFELLDWADQFSKLRVRANADTPTDAKVARSFGAVGIGLCRTEHMFFEGDRIDAVREMILADDEESRERALEKIYPMQRDDFVGILEAMAGLPVTIRLLDPPLHEFLPHEEEEMVDLAKKAGLPLSTVKRRCSELAEFNPMMGHRGCRLGITHPAIYRMQVRAILDAALDLDARGVDARPEIMIPLVGIEREIESMRQLVAEEAEAVYKRRGRALQVPIGTMIEVPRAALLADRIAKHADFFSFGTNDLTQMTFGFSRDDAKFLQTYQEPGVDILKVDPFVSLDQDGVGSLVQMATAKGRGVKEHLKVGICGEHGGDPASIQFVHGVGLDYVSCSPYRVPIARLAAARASVGSGVKDA
jgi:pyruvate,orthophosphate dikinase